MTSYKKPILLIFCFLTVFNSFGQYFGRNKPGYKVFKFKVYSSPEFEFYHYLNNDSIVEDLAIRSEQWYKLHQVFIGDTLDFKNPIVFYENHGDFQQTNITNNIISVGIGGFTEGLKNRVVLPLSLTSKQTDHVLGHELVHAFQYNYLLNTTKLSLQKISHIPLWMIEGMAEYLSVGSVDPNTSMWLRDDVLNNNLPTLHEMTYNPKYNPYRYGQAFWAYVEKTYGEEYFAPLLSATAKIGLKRALEENLGLTLKPINQKKKRWKSKKQKALDKKSLLYKDFDSVWHHSIKEHYSEVMQNITDQTIGEILFNNKNAGDYNFSPVISPNGKYVVFISEKDLFSMDLYLAEVETGKILKRFNKIVNNNEVDGFNFIESAGTWSHDSKYFAYVVYEKGKSNLLIVDIEKKKVIKKIRPNNLSSISQPAWGLNPDLLIFSGQKNGLTDLYIYNLRSDKYQNITQNGKSNIQANWSPNGKKVVYITEDKIIHDKTNFLKYEKNIAIYDIATKTTEVLDVFVGASNYNPCFSPDNKSIYFLSDIDGFRNMYRYNIEDNKTYQTTYSLTGISGITMESPAFSISQNGTLLYTYYSNHSYSIYKTHISNFRETVITNSNASKKAATLPPYNDTVSNFIDQKLNSRDLIIHEKEKKYNNIKFQPKFKLDYISGISAGISTGHSNPGIGGGTTAIFSDILGDNKLLLNLNINGTINDFGGIIAYQNNKRRVNYGFSFSHTPFLLGYKTEINDTLISLDEEERLSDLIIFDQYRILESRVMITGNFPISTTMRLEGAISFTRYGYQYERYYNYYDTLARKPYGIQKQKLSSPKPNIFFQGDLAFVLDNSYFGITSPLKGNRFRMQISKSFGDFNYYTTIFDYRKYYFSKPIGLAFRFLNYNRIGNKKNNGITNSLYLGYPWYIRGYSKLNKNQTNRSEENTISNNLLSGNKMIVSNFEVRLPFTGPKKITLINSKHFFSDLVLFADIGIIWDNDSKVRLIWEKKNTNERVPLMSTGMSLRINLWGYMILEPYYAFPFQLKQTNKGVWGVNIVPGW